MTKKRVGPIEKSLIDKAEVYKKLTGTSTVGLIEKLLAKFFENTLLTNDFLEIDKPFYFLQYPEYYKNNIIKCSLEVPNYTYDGKKIEPNEIYLINKIPNNLDTFNIEHNRFCYGNNPYRHKGIYIFHEFKKLSDIPNECNIENIIYLFDYNEKENSLIIEIIDPNELDFKIDLATHKNVYYRIVDELKNYKEWIYEPNTYENTSKRIYDIESDVFLNYMYVIESFSVIQNYEDEISMKNYLITNGNYDPEDYKKGTRVMFSMNKKLIKPSDLRKLINNE